MKKNYLFVCLCFFLYHNLSAQFQKKENDSDVNYQENVVPPYDLPEVLIAAEGFTITNSKDWTTVRRPQILSLFSHLVYGRIPAPEFPIQTGYTVLETDPSFMQGKASKQTVKISFSNQRGAVDMTILVFIPNNAAKPVPAFMQLSFNKITDKKVAIDEKESYKLGNGTPLGEILDQGYGYIHVYHADLVAHNEIEFKNTIHQLFFMDGQSFPKAHEWGVISAIGYGAMKALDYLETVAAIDHQKVALLGHSKLGKATLWAAAQDQRFAMAISANSGCGGAALWRRKFGETLAKISVFPHWLCTNSRKFIHQEDDLPVDQHMLLALMAPRPVYVASAEEDNWADPKGEYLSAYHANEVYQLFGSSSLLSSELPPLNQAIIRNPIGYHIRSGGHYINEYDWSQFLAFANYHLQ